MDPAMLTRAPLAAPVLGSEATSALDSLGPVSSHGFETSLCRLSGFHDLGASSRSVV